MLKRALGSYIIHIHLTHFAVLVLLLHLTMFIIITKIACGVFQRNQELNSQKSRDIYINRNIPNFTPTATDQFRERKVYF